MWSTYAKTALRTFSRNRGVAGINVAGLAVGMACCLLILLYVRHEWSYDRYHEHADRLYRIVFRGDFGGETLRSAAVAAPTAEALAADFPDVESVARLYIRDPQRIPVRAGAHAFVETGVAFADDGLFDVFTLPLLRGDPSTALAAPRTIVLSEAMARKYFGADDPLGRTLTLEDTTDYTVTGVFRAIPEPSHFHFDAVAALTTLEESRHPGWLNNLAFRTYLVLREGADPRRLEARFSAMVNRYMPDFAQRYDLQYALQSVTDIHLHSDMAGELEPNGDVRYVYLFSVIAGLILAIACVNFANLSTARSAARAREIGVRKVVGAVRSQLVMQFLAESVLTSLAALAVACVLTVLALPAFNTLTGKALTAGVLVDGRMGLVLVGIVLGVGVLAGGYPAFVLSGFSPLAAFRRTTVPGTSRQGVRGGLVVFQFAVSILLMVGAVVVYRQLGYVQQKRLGFEREHVLVLHDASLLDGQLASFTAEIRRDPAVVSASVSGYLPVASARTEDVVQPEGRYREDGTLVQTWRVDVDYVRTLGMNIVAGRDFSPDLPTDSAAVLVNEAAVAHFGWEEPLGKHVLDLVAVDPDAYVDFTVIGVVRDFHYASLRDRIGPVVLFLGLSPDLLSLRLATDDLPATLRRIEDAWKRFAPGQPFAYSFLYDRFAAMYRAERRVGVIFGLFAALAIGLGCLGLFGLATFTVTQRTREVAIRKVVGASTAQIVGLLTRAFMRWVVIAAVIACPVAYVVMHRWLEGFAYRTSLGMGPLLLASALALLVAFLTVGYQAIRAGRVRLVDALHRE